VDQTGRKIAKNGGIVGRFEKSCGKPGEFDVECGDSQSEKWLLEPQISRISLKIHGFGKLAARRSTEAT
jgi:hypothetical protein